jgi:hypothetical protein
MTRVAGGRRGSRRSILVGVASLAVGASVALAPAAAAAAPGAPVAPAAHLSVVPSTNLTDLQTVHVTGEHFPVNSGIVTVQCRKGATGPPDCDLNTVTITPSDATGAFTVDRYVRRIITTGVGQLDCAKAPGACVMAGADVVSPHIDASTALSFNPKVPPRKATLTVTPATNLRDHQLVKLVGGGVPPASLVTIVQCAPGPPSALSCDLSTLGETFGGPAGGFYLSYPVHRLLLLGGVGGQTVDCATVAGHCQLVAGNPNASSAPPAVASLTFAKGVPPASQNLFVFPNGNLHDKQLVTASGNGFTPGFFVTVLECRAGATSPTDCDASNFTSATAGFVGHFAIAVAVHRFIATSNGPVDCASAPGACALTAVNTARYSIEHAMAPLLFNPSIPPPTVTLSVTPHAGLHDNEAVSVRGSGFTPLGNVQLSECSSVTLNNVPVPFCANTVTITADQHGHVAATFYVHAVIAGPKGLVGCSHVPGTCTVGATEDFNPVPEAQVPLSFG